MLRIIPRSLLLRRASHSSESLESLELLKKKLFEILPRKTECPFPSFLIGYYRFSFDCRLLQKKPRAVLTEMERRNLLALIKNSAEELNKELTDASKCYIENVMHVRKIRSAVAFLEEDLISDENEMRLIWRVMKNSGGLDALNLKIMEFGDFVPFYEWDPENVFQEKPNLKAIPFSHNWWDFGGWRHKESKEKYGPKIYPNCSPSTEMNLLPHLMHRSVIFGDCGTNIFRDYFKFSSKCRHLGTHPLAMFETVNFAEDRFLKELRKLNKTTLTVCRQKRHDYRVVRSAIEMLKVDIIPFVAKAPPLWEKFMEGQGIRLLNERLKGTKYEVGKPRDLRNIPMSEWWWSEEERELSERHFGPHIGRIVSFSAFFEVLRERMLCFLEYSAELIKEKNKEGFKKNSRRFLVAYFDYSTRCRRHRQDPWQILSPEGQTEFDTHFPAVLSNLHCAFHDLKEVDLFQLRKIRSAVEMLEVDVISGNDSFMEEWKKIKNEETLSELDGILEEGMGTRTALVDLAEVPRQEHSWWPEDDWQPRDSMKWDWR